MKSSKSFLACLTLLTILSGCSFNYSESGKQINFEKDSKELSLAKKSLQYIAESKTDSLKKLLNEDVLRLSRHEQLEWLFNTGKRVMDNNEYPNDSIITVTYTTNNSVFGKKTIKEFSFPFINERNSDSTMYFKISIANDEISKLMLSTGMRFSN